MLRGVVSSPLIFAAMGGFLLMMGGWASYQESLPYMRPRTSQSANVLALAAGASPGLSIQSQQLFLQDCRQALTSFASYAQPPSVRDRMIEGCLTLSDRIVESSPSFSIAWLTGALAATQLRDWDGANGRLVRSQITGPSQQWIAELRVELAAILQDRLSAPAISSLDEDLRLLLGSYEGIRTIAQFIVDQPEFRERVIAITETFPMDERLRINENISRLADQIEARR